MKISFWGGPRDGDVIDKKNTPSEELFCATGTSELIEQIEFYKSLRHHPDRTQEYNRYVLDSLTDGKVVYKYEGVV